MFLKTGDLPDFSGLEISFACVSVRCLVRISSLEGSFSALAIEWETNDLGFGSRRSPTNTCPLLTQICLLKLDLSW
jgi:hypothetical protein